MSDSLPPDREPDDLGTADEDDVSAFLDDQLSPAESAELAADPRLAARAAELAAAAAAIADVPLPPAEVLEDLLAAALAAAEPNLDGSRPAHLARLAAGAKPDLDDASLADTAPIAAGREPTLDGSQSPTTAELAAGTAAASDGTPPNPARVRPGTRPVPGGSQSPTTAEPATGTEPGLDGATGPVPAAVSRRGTRSTRRGPGRAARTRIPSGPRDADLADRRRIGRVTGLAGFVLLLLVAVPTVLLIRSASEQTSSQTAASQVADSAAAAAAPTSQEAGDTADAAGEQAGATRASSASPALGSFATGTDLLAAVRQSGFGDSPTAKDATPPVADAPAGATEAEGTFAAGACPAVVSAPGQPPASLVGTAVLGGQPVSVWTVTHQDGVRAVVAVDTSCRTVLDAPL